jgi:hypothetical protein
MRALVLALFGLCIVQVAWAHSWVACADYDIENGEYYDDALCKGYPRNWDTYKGSAFGVDTGYNYQTDGVKACINPMASPVTAGYTDRYPMAKYAPGERVCLAWPSKNHVAAPCTNPYIPDTSLTIMLSPLNPTVDPPMSVFRTNVIANLTAHQNGVIDYKGYQRCPKFCENMDKSFCSQCFNLPATLAEGRYVMLWYWIFNEGTPAYTTCMDITVSKSSSSGAVSSGPATTTAGPTTTTTTTTTTAGPTTTTTTATTATTGSPATTGAPATTTGAPATSGSSGGSDLVVFDDALGAGFTTSWSWQATVSTSSPAYAGMNALKAVVSPWGGLQFGYNNAGFSWSGKYTKLSFAVKADAPVAMSVWFSGSPKRSTVNVGTNWSVVTLTLQGDLEAPASLFNPGGLVFFRDGAQPATIYLDSVKVMA